MEAGLPRRRRRRWVVHLPDRLVHLLARDLILARQVRSIGLGECLWVAAALTGAGRQVAGRQVAGTLQSFITRILPRLCGGRRGRGGSRRTRYWYTLVETSPTRPPERLLGACDKPACPLVRNDARPRSVATSTARRRVETSVPRACGGETTTKTTAKTPSSANEAGYVISDIKGSGIGLHTPTALFSRNVPQRWKETVVCVQCIFGAVNAHHTTTRRSF